METYALTPQWIDLYGHYVKVLLLLQIRSQERFENIQELIEQMKLDAKLVYKGTTQVDNATMPHYLG